MADVQFFQVTSYPGSPQPDSWYVLKRSANRADLRVTDSAGVYYDVDTDAKVLAAVIASLNIVNGSITDGDTLLAGLGKSQGQINAINATLSNKQPLNTDLTAISGLTPANDDILQRKSGVWVNRTPSQFKGDLSLTKADVGLGSVDNTADASKPVSTLQAAAIAVVQADIDAHEANTSNPHSVTKSQVGLSNVDNTADASKPVSTAQAAADAVVLAAANTYADGLVVGLLDDRGNYDASGNAFPTGSGSGSAGAILKGDLWTISVAGTLGSSPVTAGDVIRALTNTPGQTASNWAISENNIGYVAENSANKDTDGTLSANSDVKYPSQKAVKTYADTKVPKNASITGATKTKLTYDANGLVTSGADATTTDIADSTDKRYVTDAQRTVISNTTGTNSGNETNTTIGNLVTGATAKTTPIDADLLPLSDSTGSGIIRKLSWANLKATLKTYFDTLYAAAYTFGSGLTNTSGTVTNDLSTGKAGGQSVVGGTATDETLTLSSTTHATKGLILLGNSAYNEKNNRLGIGTNTDDPKGLLEIYGNAPGSYGMLYLNGNSFSNVYYDCNGTPSDEVGLKIRSNGAPIWQVYKPGSSTDLRIYSNVLGGDVLTITNTGLITANNSGGSGIVEINRSVVSAAGTVSLNDTYNHYVGSGTTSTWTLPALSTNLKFYLKNRGSGNITVNSNAGGNDIYSSSAVNTITLTPGSSMILFCDGTYFNVE